jgi:hypothetical protein
MARLLLVVCGCCAFLVLASVAAAAPPERFHETIPYSGSGSCGAFNDLYAGTLEITGMTTFDKAGNPVKDVVHYTRVERNWRSDNPAVSITSTGNWNEVFDYATDTLSINGQVYKQTYPGLGLLFHDVGKLIFGPNGVVIHGPHDVFAQGDAAFCNALIAVS